MDGKRAGEVAEKSEVNPAPAKAEEKAVENKKRPKARGDFQITRKQIGKFYFDRARFLRATLAPCLPRAVRVFLGKCAIVFFRRAALAAFLMFRFAAAFCFLVVISAIHDGATIWVQYLAGHV